MVEFSRPERSHPMGRRTFKCQSNITPQENNEDIIHFPQDLEACIDKLDGTNTCPFLAIKNADMLYAEPTVITNKEELKRNVENVLQNLLSQHSSLSSTLTKDLPQEVSSTLIHIASTHKCKTLPDPTTKPNHKTPTKAPTNSQDFRKQPRHPHHKKEPHTNTPTPPLRIPPHPPNTTPTQTHTMPTQIYIPSHGHSTRHHAHSTPHPTQPTIQNHDLQAHHRCITSNND